MIFRDHPRMEADFPKIGLACSNHAGPTTYRSTHPCSTENLVENPVLLLNADHNPLKILPWQRGVELVMDNKANAIENIEGKFVRSPSFALPWPSVISLRRYAQVRGRVKFSARNVQARDHFQCAYCGLQPRLRDGRPDREQLTLDHVIPRAQSKHATVYLPWNKRWVNVTSWENSATACRRCNATKADRTPIQAGMKLRILPRVPTQSDVLRMSLGRLRAIPDPWIPYLPENWQMNVLGLVGEDVENRIEQDR